MKSKITGLIILLLVVTLAAIYSFGGFGGSANQSLTSLQGYLGGEKIGLLEDPALKAYLQKNYSLHLDYAKAGSLDMVAADHSGKDYLFPSSRTALDLYQRQHGKPLQAEVIFNTPIVIYTRTMVRDALLDQGLVTLNNGVYYMDMAQLVEGIKVGKPWSELGLPALYGGLNIQTTDPTASNSGNMFAGLLANVLNHGQVVDATSVDAILPDLRQVFSRLGYMEKSSADLFDQFLKTGVGAKPMIAGYESQLLEFAITHPQDWQKIQDEIVVIYPIPTVWSSHVYIALNEDGKRGIVALLDPEIQKMAWEKHGFRTSVYELGSDTNSFGVTGIADQLTQITPMPDSETMAKIIDHLP